MLLIVDEEEEEAEVVQEEAAEVCRLSILKGNKNILRDKKLAYLNII